MDEALVWKTGAGAVTLTARPLGLCIPLFTLSIAQADKSATINGKVTRTQAGNVGKVDFELSATRVAALLSSPDWMSQPYLTFRMDAVKKPGAPGPQWGWALRIARGGTAMPAMRADGSALTLDSNGFVNSALQAFPAGKPDGHDRTYINLTG